MRRLLIAAVAALALVACNSEEVRDVEVGDGGTKVVRVDGVRMRLIEITLGTGFDSERVHCLVGTYGESRTFTCWPV